MSLAEMQQEMASERKKWELEAKEKAELLRANSQKFAKNSYEGYDKAVSAYKNDPSEANRKSVQEAWTAHRAGLVAKMSENPDLAAFDIEKVGGLPQIAPVLLEAQQGGSSQQQPPEQKQRKPLSSFEGK